MNREDVIGRISDFFQELSKEGMIVHSFHGEWPDASNWDGKKFRLTNARINVEIFRGCKDEDY